MDGVPKCRSMERAAGNLMWKAILWIVRWKSSGIGFIGKAPIST